MTAIVRQLVTQSGVDTFTSVAIDTNLTVDGKSAWEIVAIEAQWFDAASVAAGDYALKAMLSTVSTATAFTSANQITDLDWCMQNTGGVAVAVIVERVKRVVLIEPRLTVQPLLYLGVESGSTGQANDVMFKVYYNIVKLSDLEVMRLLIGGV